MFLGLSGDQWLDIGISVLMVALAAVLGRWLVNLLLGRLGNWLARRTATSLDDTILTAIRPPLIWALLVLVLNLAIVRLDLLPESWDEPVRDIFFVLNAFIVMMLAGRLVHYLLLWYGREMAERTETNLDEQLLPFFRRLVLVFLVLIGLIILLGRFVNVSSLVTTLGVGSLAIALAAQAALEDSISGMLIMLDRPFRIGDRIEIQDLDTWGDVVDIGLRSTHIRTRDNRMVVVPNSVIGKSLIVNHAYPNTEYRIQIHIGVAYGVDLESARQTMIKAVRQVEGVLSDHPVEALFLEFGDSALMFRVRWWIGSYQDTRRMFDRVNTALYNALNAAGIEMPYPQQDINLRLDAETVERLAAAGKNKE